MPLQHSSYGTYDASVRSRRSTDEIMAPGLEHVRSRSRLRDAAPPPAARREKDIAMRRMSDAVSTASDDTHESAQAGVKQVEAIAKTWDTASLALAYFGVALIAWATSLESLTTSNLTIYATSAFNSHSLVSTVLVIQGVVLSVVKPPMSKIADVFGRFEAFCLSAFLLTIGYIQQAGSNGVDTYAAAQLFYAAGATGLQILIQVFVADTSSLVNRAICITLPDLPFLVNVWIGPPLAEAILERLGWRWGYGIWAVVLPVCFLPLAISLVVNVRRAAKRRLLPPNPFKDETFLETAKRLWFELDFFGLVLICGSFTLILIPLTLASRMGWNDSRIVAMLIVGVVCLVAFPFWESSSRLAPRAFLPKHLLVNKTLMAALGLAFFYFMTFFLSIYPYFQSYLLVVMDLPLASAGRIIQTFTLTSTITSLTLSLLIKRFKRYKFFMVAGCLVYILGVGLMFIYRREGVSTATLVAAQAIVGMGGSMIHLPAQLGVQASVSHQDVAASTAIFLTVLEIGGAVGSAISGAIWTTNVLPKLAAYLPPETRDQAQAIYGNITLASNGWPMGSPTRVAINRAYQETMTKILTVAFCAAVPCLFFALMMKDYELDKVEQPHVQDTAPRLGDDGEATSARHEAIVEEDEEETHNGFAGPSSSVRSSFTDDGVDEEQRPLVGYLHAGPSISGKGKGKGRFGKAT